MARRTTHAMHCAICGQAFTAYRSDARTCGPRCKKALQRAIVRELGHACGLSARDLDAKAVQFRKVSPLSPADGKGDALKADWPHGLAVRWRRFPWETWKPGRVCWHCSIAETAIKLGQVPLDAGFFYEACRPEEIERV